MIKMAARALLFLLLILAIVSGGWEWAAAIQFQRGKSFLDNKEWFNAMTAFQSSVRIFPRNPEAHRWLAKSYLYMVEGRNPETQVQLLKDAEKELDKALAIEPRYPYYWFDLARVSELLEQLRADHEKSALYCYRQAALIDPNNPVFLEAMGAYLLENGEKEAAKGLFAKLLTIDINYAITLAGVWLQHKYDPQELVSSFSGSQKGLARLVPVLISYQQFKAATMAGQKVYEADPKNPQAIVTYGMVTYYTGDCVRLKEIMSPTFKLPDYRVVARNYYAMCLYVSQQYDLAEEEYLRLVELQPANADFRWHLAQIYLSTSRQAKAKEQLILLANQPEIADHDIRTQNYLELAKVFDNEHDRGQALKYYQLYLGLKPDDQAVKDRVKILGKAKSENVIYSPWEMKK